LDYHNFLVTGANGFLGRILCKELGDLGYPFKAACRNSKETSLSNVVEIPNIDAKTDWSAALKEVDVVIHLAARVHVMKESSTYPLYEFRKVNVDGTKRLALQAAEAGVKRLIYVSSIKVNGEKTTSKPFDESDPAAPEDAYGISKYEAELVLHDISKNTGLEIVIIRPPLIYGPSVKGNLLQLIKVLTTGIPLPLGSIKNLRSLLYVDNLVEALILCATHPKAAGKTYLISDGDDVSTPALIKTLAEALGLKAKLLNCPVFLLNALGKIAGKSEQVNRLTESLQVNNSKIMRELGWKPKFSLLEGLKQTFAAGTF
jgi:nucleoside-diphosphate-sugar epimerase